MIVTCIVIVSWVFMVVSIPTNSLHSGTGTYKKKIAKFNMVVGSTVIPKDQLKLMLLAVTDTEQNHFEGDFIAIFYFS